MIVRFHDHVCSGYRVVAVTSVQAADPDNGVSHAFVDDLRVFDTKGRPLDFLVLSPAERARLTRRALDEFNKRGSA